MTAEYPLAEKDFFNKVNDEHDITAPDLNDIQDEVEAVENFIGTVAKTHRISLTSLFAKYRKAVEITITGGDTVNVPAQEMMIDGRGCRNTSAITRDLADDIAASVSTEYYLYAVDDNVVAGTFSLLFRTSNADNFTGERMIAKLFTAASGSPPDLNWLIDSDIIANPVAFSVNKDGTNQTGIVTATWTKLTWSTEVFDTNNNFASDKFIPTIAGKYILIGSIEFTTADDQTSVICSVLKNGGQVHQGVVIQASGTGTQGSNVTAVVEANGIADQFELWVWHTSTTDKIIDGTTVKTYFQGFRVLNI